jgi:hypothetical protein
MLVGIHIPSKHFAAPQQNPGEALGGNVARTGNQH